MSASLTVSDLTEIKVLPGTGDHPVFIQGYSFDVVVTFALFLTEDQADELAQLLWNRKVKREEVA